MAYTWLYSMACDEFNSTTGFIKDNEYIVKGEITYFKEVGQDLQKTTSFDSTGYTLLNKIGTMYLNYFKNEDNQEIVYDKITEQQYLNLGLKDAGSPTKS